jgi:hypothetical protein
MTGQATFEAFNALARLDVYCSDIFLFSGTYRDRPLPFFHRVPSGKCYFDIFERCLFHTRDAVKPLGNPKVNAALNEMVNLTRRMIEGHATQPWVPYRSPASTNVVPPALQLNMAGIALYLASGTIWNHLAERVVSIVSVWPSPAAIKAGDTPYWRVTLPGHDPVRVAYTGIVDAAFDALLVDTGSKVVPAELSARKADFGLGQKGIVDAGKVVCAGGIFFSSHADMAIEKGYIIELGAALPNGVEAFTIMPNGEIAGSINLNCRIRSQAELMAGCGWAGSSSIDTTIEKITESLSKICAVSSMTATRQE